jgi:hypothetical protein
LSFTDSELSTLVLKIPCAFGFSIIESLLFLMAEALILNLMIYLG